MIIIYKENNWDVIRIENIVSINIVEINKLLKVIEEDINMLTEIMKELRNKSEILGDFVLDMLGKAIRERSKLLLQKNRGYNYAIYVSASDGTPYSFYIKKLGNDNAIERIISREPIEYILIDADEGIIEIK